MSFLDPLGIFDGGGSSSSSSVTLTINGLDKIGETIELKPIELKPIELKPVTINENIELKPVELKPVTINENIDLKPVEVKPLTINENIDLKPVTIAESFDLKPVAVDTCQTLKLAPFPDTEVCQPYRHHIAYTLFGIEYAGVTYDGEAKQVIESPRRPQVIERIGHTEPRRLPPVTEYTGSRGIRVRVLDPDDE
jgi:hypothetical protein